MSTAFQLSNIRAAGHAPLRWCVAPRPILNRPCEEREAVPEINPAEAATLFSLAFYRRHTVKMLHRYLYASMLIGRAPSILNEPITRGWVSSRPVRTFEDAVIFVLDMENCLARLRPLDRMLLAKVVLQEYSHEEVALLFRIGLRALDTRLGVALDRLTECLMHDGLLVMD